jgi:hypothetical protein
MASKRIPWWHVVGVETRVVDDKHAAWWQGPDASLIVLDGYVIVMVAIDEDKVPRLGSDGVASLCV